MEWRDSIRKLIAVEKDRKFIEEFARASFYKEFPPINDNTVSWRAYKGFTLIDETKLQINYFYGVGDMEFDDSFTVNI